MQQQSEQNLGIFLCDETLVLTDKEMKLSSVNTQRTVEISNDLLFQKAGMFKNSDLFLSVWEKIKLDGRYQNTDWTVKADPDTVFFPDRLRKRLGGFAQSKSVPKFFANCHAEVDVQAKEHPHFMYGPLEVFSEAALKMYFSRGDRCKVEVGSDEKMWEERYMTHCLELLGARMNPYLHLNLLSDPHCDNTIVAPSCTSDAAAFHPFGTAEAYLECWTTAHEETANELNVKK